MITKVELFMNSTRLFEKNILSIIAYQQFTWYCSKILGKLQKNSVEFPLLLGYFVSNFLICNLHFMGMRVLQ